MVDVLRFLDEGEDAEFEVKRAQGIDGRGEIPKDFWPSYSAFANTSGGYVLLGVQQADAENDWEFVGLTDCKRLQKMFFDQMNDRNKISASLVTNDDFSVIEHEGKQAVLIYVRKADRHERPVYTGTNPLTGTWRRNYEGDYLVKPNVVRRMLAEATEESHDGRRIPRARAEDLNVNTIRRYRAAMRARDKRNQLLRLQGADFLRALNAMDEDPTTGRLEVTAAGLLMFGQQGAIGREFPGLRLDYQEKASVDDTDFTHRITVDGTWSGNLFDFYLKVSRRLAQRAHSLDDEQLQRALREALVNALIHADYNGTTAVYIASCKEVYRFRNPGGLRVPLRRILKGTVSDCRNKILQKLFFLVGAAEQAGTGVPRIFATWKEHQWRPPLLREDIDPEMTTLDLRTIDIFPAWAVKELDATYGSAFRQLKGLDRFAVVTALVEGRVTNERIRDFKHDDSRAITNRLKKLVELGFLESSGVGRGTAYTLARNVPENDGAGT